MMNRITVPIACKRCTDPVDMQCITTPTPGLVVLDHHRPCGHFITDTGWNVVHARSGLMVGHANDPESAMFLAEQLGKRDLDWTLSGNEIVPLRHRVADLVTVTGTAHIHPRKLEALAR